MAKGTETDSKELFSTFSATLCKTIIGMAACSKINTVRLAKALFSSGMATKLFDSKQEGLILLELFKGHVIVAQLHPEMDFKKDVQEYFEAIVKQYPLSESSLGIEGSLALLNIAEQHMLRSAHGFELAEHLLTNMLKHPITSAIVREKLTNSGLKLIFILFKSKQSKDYERGLLHLIQLSPVITSDKKTIVTLEKCLTSLANNPDAMKNKSIDKPLKEVFSLLYGHRLFDHFSQNATITIMKALLLTARTNLENWAVKIVPEWEREYANAHERLMVYLIELCKEADHELLVCAHNLFNEYDRHARNAFWMDDKIRSMRSTHRNEISREAIIIDCQIAICSRLKNKLKLIEAFLCFNFEKVRNTSQAIYFLLRGMHELPFAEYSDDQVFKNLDTFLKKVIDTISNLNQEEVNLISEPIMDIFCKYIEVGKIFEHERANSILPKQLTPEATGKLVFLKIIDQFYREYFQVLKRSGKVSYNSKKLLLRQLQNTQTTDGNYDAERVIGLYNSVKHLYDRETLKCLQLSIEDILKNIHNQLIQTKFLPLKEASESEINKEILAKQINTAASLLLATIPFYKFCSPEMGREAYEFLISNIKTYQFKCMPTSSIYKWIKQIKAFGIFELKRTSLFQIVPLEKEEQFQVHKQYLRIYSNVLFWHFKTDAAACFINFPTLIKEIDEFSSLVKEWKQTSFYPDMAALQIYVFTGQFVNMMVLNQKKEFFARLDKYEMELKPTLPNGKDGLSSYYAEITLLLTRYLYNLFILRALVHELKALPGNFKDNYKLLLNREKALSLLATTKILQREPFCKLDSINFEVVGEQVWDFLIFLQPSEKLTKIISDASIKECCDLSLTILDRFGKYSLSSTHDSPLGTAGEVLERIFDLLLKDEEKEAYLKKYRELAAKHTGQTTAEKKSSDQPESKTPSPASAPASKSKAKKHRKKNRKV
jgi:hypothetical protein